MKTRAIGLGLIVSILLGGAFARPSVALAAASSVSSVPSLASVAPGGNFDVSIRISTDTPTRGMQFILNWDTSKVTCNSADKGTFYSNFAQANSGSLFWSPDPPQIDNSAGKFPKNTSVTGIVPAAVAVTGALNADNSPKGVTGQGEVYILHMTANTGASGTATFTLSEVNLGDVNAVDLHPAINNGTVTISASGTGSGTGQIAVSTDPAGGITATAATLKGNLTNLGGSSTATVSFEYGTSTSYGTSTPGQSVSATGSFTASITALSAGTTYHFRAKAAGSATVYGSDQTFATPASGQAPAPMTAPATGQTPTQTQTGVQPTVQTVAPRTVAPTVTPTAAPNTARARTPRTTSAPLPTPTIADATASGTDSPEVDLSNAIGLGGTITDTLKQTVGYGQNDTVEFTIPSGTRAVDAGGAPLIGIRVGVPANIPDPPGRGRIVSAFDLLPKGATFSEPIKFDYKMDVSQLETGEDAERLHLYYYDETVGDWLECGSEADGSGGVIAEVSHFSLYAVVAEKRGGLLGALNGAAGVGWSLMGSVVLVELLVGVLVIYLMWRRKSPVIPAVSTAAAGAPGRYEGHPMPQQARTAVAAPGLTGDRPSTRETQRTVWDELLIDERPPRPGFNTEMEITGGSIVLKDGRSPDIHIIGSAQSRIVISLEYDPESKSRTSGRIVIRGLSSEAEGGK
jgi:hypothetical protein